MTNILRLAERRAWRRWCVDVITPERGGQTIMCNGYGCRVSILFCRNHCRHRQPRAALW